ncbi:hypothetical protein [Olsenella massiliensis]|uniref:hypothetical protein n=1 Tax=Olsenella massiliensis TaxID=1622075 RepID=UPI0011DD92F7|nr:hypothetical protein [Olsenella massiliensis]
MASEDHSSGLDAGSVTVSLTRQAGMGAQADRSEETRSLAVDGEGWATIDLEGEGLYRLDDIKVSARDRYGNRLASRTLADYRDALPEQERSAWGFDSILVDLGSAASVRTRLEDDEATPPSAKPYYHRGEVRERVLVTDPWFPVYASLASGAPLVTGTLSVPGASAPETLSLSVLPRDFTPVEGAENVWESVVSLPRADGGKLPREGDYTLRCEYGGVRSKVLGDDPHTDEQSFGVDYTAPDLGSLTFSQTSPFPVRESGDKRGTPWGWVFSPDGEQVTLAVTDRLSGVVGEGLSLASHPTGNVALTFEPDAAGGLSHESDPLAGVASFSLSQDGQRVVLAGSAITAVDAAGNAATVDLAALGSNLPADALGVAVDTEAPVVSVSYDNDDVRNGRYFNARRTATVTVQDASFDLTKEFAPETVVASGFKDGSQHAGRTLAAKDFEPITQEDGTVVYVATLPFDEDGDWRLSTGYTDPAGHASNATNDEFTIDTEAPRLQVSFDNNDVSNAMYYKAPRTATITVDDRNFAPQLGSIDASALQAGPGPSVGAWSETRPRATWVATASFAGETHYRLKVVVSDLAGNVSEAYDSQEFVIDLTAPEVAITGVQDHHAYGGEAAAGATFKDTNLDAQLSDYTLASVRDEYAFWPGKQESATATEKVVSLGDVPYESPRDDVYTLKATAVDLAGNHAETQATYSVNRFGSTYFFADGSKGVPGAFMAAPQEVDVVEVNVSGLDTSGSRVRLSQDDRARTLSPDVDYSLEANAPDAGWSSTTYRLPARLFSTDGFYRVTLTSTDAAGNLSQNTMDGKGEGREGTFPIEFAVDQTAPTSELGGVQAGAVYLDPAKEALVGSGDNLGVASVEVLRDGERLDGWEGADVQGATPTVRLLADGAAHDYRVEVRDKAGNVSASDYRGVVVTGDLLTYITRTPRLLALVVAAVVVLVGALSGGSMLAVRFRRMGERWRNPFGH